MRVKHNQTPPTLIGLTTNNDCVHTHSRLLHASHVQTTITTTSYCHASTLRDFIRHWTGLPTTKRPPTSYHIIYYLQHCRYINTSTSNCIIALLTSHSTATTTITCNTSTAHIYWCCYHTIASSTSNSTATTTVTSLLVALLTSTGAATPSYLVLLIHFH